MVHPAGPPRERGARPSPRPQPRSRRRASAWLPPATASALAGLYVAISALGSDSPVRTACAAAGALVALGAAAWDRRMEGPRHLLAGAAVALVGLGLCGLGGAWGVFPVIAAAMLGRVSPARVSAAAVAGLAVLVLASGAAWRRPVLETAAPLMFGALAWFAARYREDLEQASEAIRRANAHARPLAACSAHNVADDPRRRRAPASRARQPRAR